MWSWGPVPFCTWVSNCPSIIVRKKLFPTEYLGDYNEKSVNCKCRVFLDSQFYYFICISPYAFGCKFKLGNLSFLFQNCFSCSESLAFPFWILGSVCQLLLWPVVDIYIIINNDKVLSWRISWILIHSLIFSLSSLTFEKLPKSASDLNALYHIHLFTSKYASVLTFKK